MNKGLMCGIALVAGAAIGCLATRQYFKTKYEKISDEEIASVKELLYKEKQDHLNDLNQAQEMNKIFKKEQERYEEVLEGINYSGYSKSSEEKEEKGNMYDPTQPYMIDGDQYGEMEDYELIQVTYYADDILVDQDDDIIMDAEDQFGYECLKEFDKPGAPDAIYVRNESLETDYEIVRETQKYEDYYDSPEYDMD